MIFTTDPLYLEHRTGAHPERPERLAAISRALERVVPDLIAAPRRFPRATIAEVAAVHEVGMLDETRAMAEQGGGFVDPDTPVSARSFEAALVAAGAVSGATRAVLAGEDRTAFCAVRPPGHHATRRSAMGFCLVNSVAVAARAALERGCSRVAIVDFDVHHGNGTQEIFWEDPSVFYCSLHRYPFYPGTGTASETGSGRGLGATYNAPLPSETPPARYHEALARTLDQVGGFKPEILIVSAGFDAYRDDPIGGLNLDVEDFAAIGDRLRALADSCCGGRCVSALEGGYHVGRLGELVTAYLMKMSLMSRSV